ncbi:MAG TPA: glycosyltransferase [Alphaproteobacteria bacterium]|nr:glycosyltransferase [Alphaproteobacteria bacterium]
MSGLRVLQAIAGAAHGGAEAFFVRLVAALHRAGLTQHIVIRRDAARAAALRGAGVDPMELAFGSALDLATPLRLAQEIRAWRPDIVLTWMNRATARMPPRFLAGGYAHAARLGGYYDLSYYRRCDHLIGNTQAIVDYIREQGWPAERVHYLPNFVDATPRPPLDRAQFETPRAAPLALALGRLHENKGFDIALAALARVPSIHLWIAGEGPLGEVLKEQARRLGILPRVRFLGWRDDVAALLASADMLLCPSRHEPLGNVVIEAWAHRCPVVAAASDGPRGLIAPERDGLLVPVDDAAALAEAMQRVAEDRNLAAALAAAGRASYESRFTETAVVRDYLDFFVRIA